MRIVLDTDVLLSAVASALGASRLWLAAGLRREVRLLVSVPLMIEYEAVLRRPHQMARAGATRGDIDLLLDAIAQQAEPIAISYLWRPALRDPDDEMVLETAVNGRADWILTFDVDHYAGAQPFGIKVARPGTALPFLRGMRS